MKKSQAAMESLMTYGWAVLLVAISLLGLQYFGVFDLENHLPKQCFITQGISCLDFNVNQDAKEITFLLKNNMGSPIENVKMSIPHCMGFFYQNVIPAGNRFRVTLYDCPVSDGHLKVNPLFSYEKKDVGLVHVTTAEVSERIGSSNGISTITHTYADATACPDPSSFDCIDSDYSFEDQACFYNLEQSGFGCSGGQCDGFGNCV